MIVRSILRVYVQVTIWTYVQCILSTSIIGMTVSSVFHYFFPVEKNFRSMFEILLLLHVIDFCMIIVSAADSLLLMDSKPMKRSEISLPSFHPKIFMRTAFATMLEDWRHLWCCLPASSAIIWNVQDSMHDDNHPLDK